MPLISYEIERPEDVTDRRHRQWMKKAHVGAMETHRNKRMGKHFKDIPETAPGGAYGYTKRGAKYLKRKQQKVGHTRPMDLTGQTKRITRRSKIRATFKNATLTIRPNFAGRTRKAADGTLLKPPQRKRNFVSTRRQMDSRRQHAQRIAELEAITDSERDEIRDEMLQIYNGELTQFRRTRKRTHIRS